MAVKLLLGMLRLYIHVNTYSTFIWENIINNPAVFYSGLYATSPSCLVYRAGGNPSFALVLVFSATFQIDMLLRRTQEPRAVIQDNDSLTWAIAKLIF